MQTITKHFICLACVSLVACASIQHQPQPLEPQAVSQRLLSKDPLSADFQAFCKKQGYSKPLPFAAWGVEELTLSALYHHTQLDVAKAQLGVAQAAIESAGLKPPPILGGSVARSNRANGDIRPYAYGLNVEITVETANKRAIRLEEAQQLAESARLDVAETAWNLRSQLVQDWLDFHEQQAQAAELQHALAQQDKLVNLMEKRVQTGLAGSADLAPILTRRAEMQSRYLQKLAEKDVIIARMAADAGLSVEKWLQIPVAPMDMDATIRETALLLADPARANQLQSDALLNRIDIRRGLAKYAAAESKLKLEIAKQTPDISLTPGFIFEFGDKVWSLGFSSLFSLLNKLIQDQPTALIHQAEQLRAVEGAQFEALQANVIAEVAQAKALLQSAQSQLKHLEIQQNQQVEALKKTQKQFDAGLLDRFDITRAETLTQSYAIELLNAKFALLRANFRLENVIQRDLTQPNPTDEAIAP